MEPRKLPPLGGVEIETGEGTWTARFPTEDGEGAWERVFDVEDVGDGVTVELRIRHRRTPDDVWELDERREWHLSPAEARALGRALTRLGGST